MITCLQMLSATEAAPPPAAMPRQGVGMKGRRLSQLRSRTDTETLSPILETVFHQLCHCYETFRPTPCVAWPPAPFFPGEEGPNDARTAAATCASTSVSCRLASYDAIPVEAQSRRWSLGS